MGKFRLFAQFRSRGDQELDIRTDLSEGDRSVLFQVVRKLEALVCLRIIFFIDSFEFLSTSLIHFFGSRLIQKARKIWIVL